MKSPFYFIVNPLEDKRYDNVRKYGDNEFIISASKEDHKVTNRFAVVSSVPMYYKGPIKIGDVVVVHHNVFRIYNDMKGREKSSWNFIKDNIFIVELDQIYAYKSEDNDFKAHFPYCFIEPLPKQDSIVKSLGNEEELHGRCVYIPDGEIDGVKDGDIVTFMPESEYEFRINERKLYRMKLSNLCLKI